MTISSQKTKKIIARTIQIILIISGILGGIAKLRGAEVEVKTFEQMGFSNTVMIIFGLLQLGGALLLIVPRTLPYGAIMLLITFTVSTVALFFNSVFPMAFFPPVFITLIIILLVLRKNL